MAGELARIQTAIARTRNNALGQLGIGAVVLASFVMWPSGSTLMAIFMGMNLLFAFFFARRAWRVRASGPVARALLSAPEEIVSIQQWPAKLPDNAKAFPIAIDVHTRSGDQGTLLLDPKDRPSGHALVAALRERSPDAVVVFTPAPPKLIVP